MEGMSKYWKGCLEGGLCHLWFTWPTREGPISVSCLVHLCTHWMLGQALEVREWCLGLERVGGVVDFFSPTVGKNRFCYVGSFMIFCPNSRFFNPGVPDEDKPLQEREREGERRPVFHGS